VLIKFASAIGYELKLGLVPIKNVKRLKHEQERKINPHGVF
jgi:hypothetical protein